MLLHGYETELKCDYCRTKGNHGRNSAGRTHWRWVDKMDAVYGHRPANLFPGCSRTTDSCIHLAPGLSLIDTDVLNTQLLMCFGLALR